MTATNDGDAYIPPGAQPMREPESPQQAGESNERLAQMSMMVQDWRPLLSDPMVPTPNSSLAADDRGYDDYPPSHVAWSGIRSGIDSMCMFFDCLAANQLPYETGHRVLARAALGGSAQALFVLAPSNRTERRQNALRCAYDDLNAYDRTLTDLSAARWSDEPGEMSSEEQAAWTASETRRAERRAHIIEAAGKLGLSNTQLKKAPTFREMAEAAAGHVSERSEGRDMVHSLRMSLSQLNSAAHSGRWHAVMTATHTIDTPEGTRARLVTTATDLFLSAGGPMTLMPRAIELFQQRSQRH